MGSFRTKTFFKEKLLKVANLLYIATDWIHFSECSKFGFFMWNIWIFWNKLTFLKTAKDKKFIVGCIWFSKISENVDKVASSWEKKIGFFEKKLWVFLQIAESSQFDAESNQFCRIPHKVQELVFFDKK